MQQQLIDRCKSKDRVAQRALYDQYASMLYGCCLKYAPNKEEAQDILQDSFIIIFEKIKQFKNEGSFEGWCKRITINTALQRYRTANLYHIENENTIVDDAIDFDNSIKLDMVDMLAMIQQLPHRYQLVFSLYSLDGYSHKEISKMMEISVGTSKSNLSRARLRLQEMIKEWLIHNASDAS